MLRLSNPLTYPGGAIAGINLSHVALAGGSACRFSGVARNGNFIDLTRGAAGVRTGIPVRVMDGYLGDSVQFGTAIGATFSGRPAIGEPRMTFAAIVKWTNIAAGTYSFIFVNSSNSTGYNGLFAGSDGSLNIRYGGVNAGTTPPPALTNNIPYFVAASVATSSPINVVIRRLDNGQIVYSGPTASTLGFGDTSNGNYVVGNWPLISSFGMVGQIAAVAYTNTHLSARQLLEWAQAPWDFWYPPTLSGLISSAVANTVAAGGGSAQARALIMA